MPATIPPDDSHSGTGQPPHRPQGPVRRRIVGGGTLRRGVAVACALLLSSFSGCTLPPPMVPRPSGTLWEAVRIEPAFNTAVAPPAPIRAWHLRHPSIRFGGLSGLTALDPSTLLAVSDRGAVVRIRLTEDGSPDPSVEPDLSSLAGPVGFDMLANRSRDAEEILALPDGTILVAFEQIHRLWAYPPADPPLSAPPQDIPLPEAFRSRTNPVHRNGGVEAMALHPDGRLLIFQESTVEAPPAATEQEIRAWVGTPVPAEESNPPSLLYRWDERRIKADGDFQPSGAIGLPSGAVLLVERRWQFPGLFATQVRRIEPEVWESPQKTSDGTVIFRSQTAAIQDNFEGITLIPQPKGADGGPNILLLSDNNFFGSQKTLLLDIGRLADLDGMVR